LVSSSLQSPAAPRDLPSFPTRRSSDLGVLELGGRVRVERAQAGEQLGDLARRQLAPARGARLRHGAHRRRSRAFANARASASATDRKSTRLNSSHVKISYAVFCLKKTR